jgi:hypothetical protein
MRQGVPQDGAKLWHDSHLQITKEQNRKCDYRHYKTTRRTSGGARGKETTSTVIRPEGIYNRGGKDLYNIDNKYTIRR